MVAPDNTHLVDIQSVCTALSIRKASRSISHLYDAFLRRSGLRVRHFALLVSVGTLETATISQVAQELVMDRTTAARNIKRLGARGLLAVTPGSDRRTRLVSLTAEGEQALADAIPHWEAAQSRVVESLGQERWHAMMSDLSDVMGLKR